jgi:hypothetical protein
MRTQFSIPASHVLASIHLAACLGPNVAAPTSYQGAVQLWRSSPPYLAGQHDLPCPQPPGAVLASPHLLLMLIYFLSQLSAVRLHCHICARPHRARRSRCIHQCVSELRRGAERRRLLLSHSGAVLYTGGYMPWVPGYVALYAECEKFSTRF